MATATELGTRFNTVAQALEMDICADQARNDAIEGAKFRGYAQQVKELSQLLAAYKAAGGDSCQISAFAGKVISLGAAFRALQASSQDARNTVRLFSSEDTFSIHT